MSIYRIRTADQRHAAEHDPALDEQVPRAPSWSAQQFLELRADKADKRRFLAEPVAPTNWGGDL